MPRVLLDEIDLGSVEDAVGSTAFDTGYREMHDGVVRRIEWVPSRRTLQGVVQDTGGEFHETVAHFSAARPMRLDGGFCTCEAGCECKHAAALVLAGALASGQDLDAPRTRSVSWDKSLGSLIHASSEPAAANYRTARVAIELILSAAGLSYPSRPGAGRPQLTVKARVVQPGSKLDSWVGGQLSWDKLGSRQYAQGLADAQLRVLRELYWLHRAHDRSGDGPYYYGGSDKLLDLGRFESRQLWPLFDEAESAGLPLVYRKIGPIPPYGSAELSLDVVRSEASGPLRISPVVAIDGGDGEIWPVCFLGSTGHGLAYVDPGEVELRADPARWRFRLARLINPVPSEVQQLVMARQPVAIPAADERRFREEFYPRLRRAAPLRSSDGSYQLPEISPPTLVIGAAYSPGHELDVSWQWAYRVGAEQLRLPAGAVPAVRGPRTALAGYRDLEAERAILADLELPPGAVQPARLTGLETMKFSTETLPMLAGRPEVDVEVAGTPAEYHDAGDSLRFEVSVDQLVDDNDWFGLGVLVFVEDQVVQFKELFLALSRGDEYLLLDNGAYFSLDKPGLQALARLIEEARSLQDRPADSLRISRFHAGLWAELAELGVVTRQAAAWQRQVDGLLAFAGDVGVARVSLPSGLNARLRPYQVDGFQWLTFLWQHQLGGILADDMGLGKTLQALALISLARAEDRGKPPFLICAPTSVVSNWACEAAKFTPSLKIVVITDTMARRRTDLAELVADADAVVTTYTLLRIDFASYAALQWSGLILDEAQYTKNRQAKIYQCARRLSAPFKLAMTGTPMENNLMELWSLLSITAPGLFPHPDKFQDYYARPIEKQGNAELLEQLRRRIKPLLKRRTKEQVAADLPAKQEQVLEVVLHPKHQKLYQTHLQRERQKVLGLVNDVDANRFAILRSLTLLRQLSLHAGLVDAQHDDLPCSKLDTLLDLLEEAVAGGHRALVFSQFTRFLERARQRLDDAGIAYCYLDGRTRDRPLVIQRFKNGAAPVFLISLKAGGFGLNLTEADYCFLLDPWWNPATEAQAVDRTHRIGQTRNVVVYRLIASDTIEEKVMALKARKAALFTSVIDSGNAFGGRLSAEDIRGLFA
ncbi:MAG TPA: DEAD/DEAH box helicase [Streptosporangiaceae bacterium]|nr:DEAD/DEAH box helicase [Streptosporangiaceae bacterium]